MMSHSMLRTSCCRQRSRFSSLIILVHTIGLVYIASFTPNDVLPIGRQTPKSRRSGRSSALKTRFFDSHLAPHRRGLGIGLLFLTVALRFALDEILPSRA